MNNKGQSLVVFIICIPIILVTFAFLVDFILLSYQKVHLNSVTKTIIASNIDDKNEEEIKKDFQKNDITDKLEINIDDGIDISFNHQIDSFFGKLISKDHYDIKIDIYGVKSDDKIKYEKGHNNGK